jgi:signal transduction histidine kinase
MSDQPADSELGLPGDVRALLEAVVAISSDLDLHPVLNRIVESACRITQARYGALGVLDTVGRGLAEFVTYGLTDEQHRAIGELPRGRGILGLLIERPEAVRLEHLAEHPQSFGFPAHHPPMDSFLGVPVRIRGTVFGNLYLTEKQGASSFTEQDEMLVEVLATAAGFVIENARAYAQSERRRQWLEASVQITEALQPPIEMEEALRQITVGARRVVRADAVALLLRRDVAPQIVAADGADAARIPDIVAELKARIADAEQKQEVAVVPHGEHGVVVLVPLRAQIAPGGVLLVALGDGRSSPEAEEVDLLASLADQASLALDRAEALADREELALVADRDRIARDLHDVVIQRLFATGLHLQGARRIAMSDELRERLDNAVLDLDTTIRDIRSTIFELQRVGERSLRSDVRDLAKEYVPVLGFTPLVRTTGPLDTAVGEELGEQLLAVLREALSNTARHAEASAAVVEVEVTADRVLLSVTDNGKGIPAERQESGLRNVRRRAADHGGAVRLLGEEPHGTRLEWSAKLTVG